MMKFFDFMRMLHMSAGNGQDDGTLEKYDERRSRWAHSMAG